MGQVRAAQERALELGLCGPSLGLVFEEALRIAARVRGETKLGEGRVSLAEIAVQLLRERIATTPGRVALVGVSPMTERAALSLAQAGLDFTVVNRTPEKAAALAERFGAAHLPLDQFQREPPRIEALLTSTGAAAILDESALERLAAHTRSGQPPLIVDMAVPPDVDPAACAKLAIPRVGMDEITRRADQTRAARLMEAGPAREQVDDALDHLQDRFTERYYGPLFGALQQRFRHTAQEGVKRLLKKELKGLGEDERTAIEVWSEVLARRFAHIPCLGLRGLLHDGPDGSIDAFLNGLEPEFADELRAALSGAAQPERDSCSSRAPLKLGTRGSDLARTQSTTVADALRAAGHDVELTIIKTAGDRDQTSQFGSIGAQGIFVREIEQALVERRIELAVHSFKDLPTTSPDALVIGAVPKRVDPADLLLVRGDALSG